MSSGDANQYTAKHLLEWPRSWTLTTPNAGEDVEQQEFSYTANEKANSTITLEDSLAVSYKTKHTLTIWLSNYTSWFLPKGVKNLCSNKNLHKDVYSRFIHNCQNLEANWMSFGRWVNCGTSRQQSSLFSAQKKWTIKPQKDMEEPYMHITKWKKPIWKGYILYDSDYTTLWKRQNHGDKKKISGCRGWGWSAMNRQSTEDVQSSEDTLYDIIMMDICHYTLSRPIECTTPRMNPWINYKLWVIMLCQCRFILGKKKKKMYSSGEWCW